MDHLGLLYRSPSPVMRLHVEVSVDPLVAPIIIRLFELSVLLIEYADLHTTGLKDVYGRVHNSLHHLLPVTARVNRRGYLQQLLTKLGFAFPALAQGSGS